MSDQETRDALNTWFSSLIEAWREIQPGFVAYVEKYGGVDA